MLSSHPSIRLLPSVRKKVTYRLAELAELDASLDRDDALVRHDVGALRDAWCGWRPELGPRCGGFRWAYESESIARPCSRSSPAVHSGAILRIAARPALA